MQIVTLPNGTMFSVRSTEQFAWIQRHWLGSAFYESQMLDYIALHYTGGTFIDVGASIGNHTIFFAKMCASHVYAIEPVQESYDHMLENVAINHLTHRVTGYQCAAGDKAQTGQMIMPDGGNEGMWKFDPSSNSGSPTVRMDRLDSMLIEGNVTLIKIDAEGCEAGVLKGAINLIEEFHPAIFAEATDSDDLIDIFKVLAPLGYSCGAKFNATPTYEFKAWS